MENVNGQIEDGVVEPVKDEPVKIEIDPASAMALRLQEFDKKIAEAEATVANLKLQRATFLYDTNVQLIVNRHNAQNQAPVTPAQ
jgi:hypothetical protein